MYRFFDFIRVVAMNQLGQLLLKINLVKISDILVVCCIKLFF